MNLIEGFLKDNLFIDFRSEIIYGSDQMNLSHSQAFATLGFKLMSTSGLSQIVDRMRKDQGFVPFAPMDEYTDETCERNGWYDFFISLNDLNDCPVDTCIAAIVVNALSPDNEETYIIDLDEKEQEYVYTQLDEQCRQYLGKSCKELIGEAREKMEEEIQ